MDTLFISVKIGLPKNFTSHCPARAAQYVHSVTVSTSLSCISITQPSAPPLCMDLQSLPLLPLHTTHRDRDPISLFTIRDWNKSFFLCKLNYGCLLHFPNSGAQDSERTVKGLEETPWITLIQVSMPCSLIQQRDCISNPSSINISMWHFARSCHLCPLSCSYAISYTSLEQELSWLLVIWNGDRSHTKMILINLKC